ncbi:MAG: hypothetical protein JXA42_11710 [Anaerolineales bacterium]|nr:hypothetical protein [Anaerolineales bacterium]
MKISYPTFPERSMFIKPIENEIRNKRDILFNGQPVVIKFSAEGYNGKIKVRISEANAETFDTDWENKDESRFPRRIRAAAYALFNTGCLGEFFITHDRKTGIIEITQI